MLAAGKGQLSYRDPSSNPNEPQGSRCIAIQDVLEGDLPLQINDPIIDNFTGLTTFGGVSPSVVPWPANLGHALIRLTGNANQQCGVDLELTSLSDVDGNPIGVPAVLSQTLLRGDARADGVINIADALFIQQYLVRKRNACTTVVDISCLHSVNAASVRQDGAVDKTTVADALFIAQYLVRLRDEFYNFIP